MTKAQVVLKSFAARRILKKVCEATEISYKFTQLVSSGYKAPSMDIMRKLRVIMPVDFWFEVADEEFKNRVSQICMAEDDDGPLSLEKLKFKEPERQARPPRTKSIRDYHRY